MDDHGIRRRYRNAGKATGKARPHRPQKPCQFEGCSGWVWAQGYCGTHYQKLKREGKLSTVRIVGDPVARFHASYIVNAETGCWEWTGWIHPKGYGVLPMGGKSKKVRAHRLSWELHFGPIPDGQLALHTCDVRKCVNPQHLFLGDEGINARDCVAKGRHGSKLGFLTTKLTLPMVLNIRVLFARGLPLGRRSPHSMQKLADIYEVDQQTISRIVKGRGHKTG